MKSHNSLLSSNRKKLHSIRHQIFPPNHSNNASIVTFFCTMPLCIVANKRMIFLQLCNPLHLYFAAKTQKLSESARYSILFSADSWYFYIESARYSVLYPADSNYFQCFLPWITSSSMHPNPSPRLPCRDVAR